MHAESHVPGMPNWVDLMTDDLDGSRKFYASLFDWTFDIGPPESGHYTTCLRGGRKVAGVGMKPPGVSMPNAWSVYLQTDDIDATASAIQGAGGVVAMGPMDVMEHGRLAFAVDPTGAAFGLWQPKAHKGFQTLAEPGSFAWAECYTRDLEKASAFYCKVFGYETVNTDGLPYVTLHLGPDKKTIAGGIMQMNDDKFPKEVPPHWTVYFATDDTDKTIAKVAELGGKVVSPAFDTQYGRMAVVQDASGAAFSVIKPAW